MIFCTGIRFTAITINIVRMLMIIPVRDCDEKKMGKTMISNRIYAENISTITTYLMVQLDECFEGPHLYDTEQICCDNLGNQQFPI